MDRKRKQIDFLCHFLERIFVSLLIRSLAQFLHAADDIHGPSTTSQELHDFALSRLNTALAQHQEVLSCLTNMSSEYFILDV